MVGRKGAMEVRLLFRSSFSVSEDGEGGMHVERQRQKGAVCVRVVCARFLRAVVVLDLCPFGGRKFACA